jgi:phosphoribosylformylglycinamidine cyclo-ligase
MTEGLTAQIQTATIPVPPIFTLIAQRGNIPERDMYNTFNMGVGMILAVPKDEVGRAVEALIQADERAYVIGSVIKGGSGVELV